MVVNTLLSLGRAACAGIVVAVGLLVGATPSWAQHSVKLQCNSDDWVVAWPYDSVTCDGGISSTPSNGLIDLNGGDIDDGDVVAIMVTNIMDYTLISVAEFGGAPLDAYYEDQNNPSNDEKFQIENIDCDSCEIVDGSRISLRSVSLNKYWSAAGCGGGNVNASATSRGSCEIFEIKIY